MKLEEYTDRWSRTILPMKSRATVATFSSHIRKMNSYFGEVQLPDLSETVIQNHVSDLSKVLSPKGLKNYVGTFKLILKRAMKEGLIQSVPDPDLPKLIKVQQPWFTAKQMHDIIEMSEGQYKTLFYLLAETGLRIGEALGLQWKDIDFKNSSLSVKRSIFNGQTQPPKTGNAIRLLSISERLHSQCVESRGKPGSFIFRTAKDKPLAANSALVGGLHHTLQSLQLPICGFHAFRRGNATILAGIGMPEKTAATRLGHGLPGLTFGLYAQAIELADKPWVELIAKELECLNN